MVTVKLETLRARARDFADQAGSSFVTDTELDRHISEAVTELDSIAAEFYGLAISKRTTVTTVVGQSQYDLPTSVFRVLRVEDSGRWISREGLRSSACSCPTWEIQFPGPTLYLYPAPKRAVDLTIRACHRTVVPTEPSLEMTLVDHGDTFVACRAAMAMMAKEESSYDFVAAKGQASEARIQQDGFHLRPRMGVRRRIDHRCI